MSPTANKDTESGNNASFPSLAHAAADYIEHVRPGCEVEHERGKQEGQECSFVRHLVFLAIEASLMVTIPAVVGKMKKIIVREQAGTKEKKKIAVERIRSGS